jgi:hypothetical protein
LKINDFHLFLRNTGFELARRYKKLKITDCLQPTIRSFRWDTEALAVVLYVMDPFRDPFILHQPLFINKQNSEFNLTIFCQIQPTSHARIWVFEVSPSLKPRAFGEGLC